MANNKNINQVIYGTSTLIDLTNDTITPERMYKGIKAHMADGSTTTGTAEVTVENTRLIMPEGFIGLVSSTSDEHTPIPEAIVVSKTVTQNGTYYAASDNADGYNPFVVNVSGGGGTGLVYETGTWTPTSDTSSYWISLTNTHTEPPFYYAITDTKNTYDSTQQTNYLVAIFDAYIFCGALYYYDSATSHAIIGTTRYMGSSTMSTATITKTVDQQSDFLTSTSIRAYTNSSTRYWRSGRTYKWIAIWKPSS